MTVETSARFISQLNDSFPRNKDLIKEGDDHIRLIKNVLKSTFPGMNGSTTITADKLNKIDSALSFDSTTAQFNTDVKFVSGKRLDMNANRITNLADPVEDTDAVSLKFVKNSIGGVAWPVGSIFMTNDSADPAVTMGFGTWKKIPGRFIMGAGAGTDDNGTLRSFGNGDQGGEYNHRITVDELPNHNHQVGAGTSIMDVVTNKRVPANTMDKDAVDVGATIPGIAVGGRARLDVRAVVNAFADGPVTNCGIFLALEKNGTQIDAKATPVTVAGGHTNNVVYETFFEIWEAGTFTVKAKIYNSNPDGVLLCRQVTLIVSEAKVV